ncbi:MAG: hypothetical protein LBP87_07340, partial [Planctomycetaceae bacterium]|nr:hypothetical protein [Planctomycetaceae bacterium]
EGIALSELWHSQLFDLTTNNPTIQYNGYNAEFTNVLPKLENLTITINGGWKGPYLNVTNKKLYDGFGNDFHVADPVSVNGDNLNWRWDNNDDETEENSDMMDMVYLNNDLRNPPETILKFGSFGENNKFNDTTTAWENTNDIKKFHYSQVFSTLHVNILLRDSSTNPTTWQPAKYLEKEVKAYDAATNYKTGDVVEVEINSKKYLFLCTSPPSSAEGSSEPKWSFAGITTDEQGREWICISRTTYLNRLRVTVFSPYVQYKSTDNAPPNLTIVRAATAFYPFIDDGLIIWKCNLTAFLPTGDPPVWNNVVDPDDLLPKVEIRGNGLGTAKDGKNGDTMTEITFQHLTPGIRKIFAYGFVEYTLESETSSKYSNTRHSNVQTIELKPGENFITIYLNDSYNN